MRIATFILLGLIILGTSDAPPVAQSTLFESALKKTEVEDFEGAIQDLKLAATKFYEAQDYSSAYKSDFLADYLGEQRTRLILFEQGQGNYPVPNWDKLGSCLDNCSHSIVWANPSPLGSKYGGVLILQKHLRKINLPNGSGKPVKAILDVQIVPPLTPNEIIMTHCQFSQAPTSQDSQLLALVQPTGQDNADYYTQIRQAWKIKIGQGTIENVSQESVGQIRCINPCPGGC